MKNDLMKTFCKNWENNFLSIRTVVPALLGILAIGSFVVGALIIAYFPWLALVLLFGVFAAGAACRFHEIIDKKVKK